jgi:hypothetical protein
VGVRGVRGVHGCSQPVCCGVKTCFCKTTSFLQTEVSADAEPAIKMLFKRVAQIERERESDRERGRERERES